MAKHQTRWNERPAPEDYTAALNYLTLQFLHRMCAACHADEDSPVRGILVAPSA
jgi:hypothetical protein